MDDESIRRRNRENARKSTGPKTERGKATSRLNALKHGTTSRVAILPGEDTTELAALREGLLQVWTPVSMREEILVERKVAAEWKRRRVDAAELSLLSSELVQRAVQRARNASVGLERAAGIVNGLSGAEAASLEEPSLAAYEQHLALERELEAVRDGEGSDIGAVFADLIEVLDKFSRHRIAAERSYDRASHELERIQAERRGRQVPVPVALDVSVAGVGSEES